MWKFVYGSVQGTSHVQSAQPCQDYCAGRTEDAVLLVACSDGAGSAVLSHLGSRAAVERFLEAVALNGGAPTKEQVEGWVESARVRVIEEAAANEAAPRDLACTFLAALVGHDWAAFVQIGDGVIVFDGPKGYELAFWPQSGEYANTTRFLTEDGYTEHLRVELVERPVMELAVLTDGLQMLALDFAECRPHARFFAPLFRTVREGPDEEKLRESLLAFMDSKRVNDRTDDDKTLFLATRIPPDVPSLVPEPVA